MNLIPFCFNNTTFKVHFSLLVWNSEHDRYILNGRGRILRKQTLCPIKSTAE